MFHYYYKNSVDFMDPLKGPRGLPEIPGPLRTAISSL